MKTLRAQLNINEGPREVTEINLISFSPSASDPAYIDRSEARNMLIESGVYTEKEVERIEKIGCGEIILNFLEISPCCSLRALLAQKEAPGIMEGLKLLMSALGSEAAAVYLPKKNREVFDSIVPLVRKTPNVYAKSVKDRYPLGMEKIFSRWILRQGKNYFPGKGGILIIPPEKALQVYNYSVCGSAEKNIQVLCVLSGENGYYVRAEKSMTVKELLQKINVKAEGFIVDGDALSGRSIIRPGKESIDGKYLISLLVSTPIDLSLECWSCGRCVELCPAGLRIPRSKRSLEENEGVIPASDLSYCLGCGLCGYFCPGWIK